MFKEIPVDVSIAHAGERIRKNDLHVELGGPDVEEKFELVKVRQGDQVKDSAITVIGPDVADMEPGKSYPLGILIEVAGPELEPDFEGVIERRIHEYANYIEGLMHLNQRYDTWIRLSKKAYGKGFTTLRFVGEVLEQLLRNEFPIIGQMQITFYTDAAKISSAYAEAMNSYEARDARARGLTDDEVDVFYGCALCQSFAPGHVCVITPQRYANCGAISWFDGRAAARIDPKGLIFPIEKGSCLDPEKGEYTGINESAGKRSLGEVSRVYLYSAFTYPHTSCGCFEGIAFYIPEVEGFGIVTRGYKEATVNGLPFSAMADSTGGGRQIDGFHGLSLEYMRSQKFLAADGGYARVAWMPAGLKEQMKPFIPPEIFGKIATEREVKNVGELRQFLVERSHPVIQRWEAEEENPEEEHVEEPGHAEMPVFSAGELPLSYGGLKITLKNARIYADRAIIQWSKPKKPGAGE
ncbi:CO dehydrogenase/CO-methylating acetyl-CoA synthase complex subunit beta [Methanocella arvoryzae]|uniref:Acetyl-CoA decarbonylase/synthase complex subunit beta n=1 Tax=Methanocella arvoryzae (strain DSM 22066 / NBRC 105507 / MRE50) TaxID=351160 RepID=Q0W881_METAR|nr:CO dehydrogenase/CO-methylating acetyl-CoA synthase complex subunit beta [Methanocella arvoryzae]CAJ35412.1 carbon monoxide dehydrogenase/acetyl-CoA synthase complex, beta subunit [Methanocella arvoryzae MRE50]